MKKLLALIFLIVLCSGIYAQTITVDTVKTPNVTVNKDPRLDILAKAEAEINNMANRFAMGYRLFVLKTNNRDYAMKVRTYLLQNFPEEKVIMTYQAPFIKMKFGNFIEKKDAEKYRDMIVKGGVVTGGVYVVPETVEVDPSKIKEND
jgi:hypothetical protein